MISLTGNSGQTKVAAAVLPETMWRRGGLPATLGTLGLRARVSLPPKLRNVGAVIPNKSEPVWLI